MTARAFRYPNARPVPLFAITDMTEAQFRMLIEAGEFYLEDTGNGTDPNIDYRTVGEVTAILRQGRAELEKAHERAEDAARTAPGTTRARVEGPGLAESLPPASDIEAVARQISDAIPDGFPMPGAAAAIGCAIMVHAQGDQLAAVRLLAAAMAFVATAECGEPSAPEARNH
ncbi:hypothetical protein DWF04_021370 [Cereibacter sphaeroides f. sp. denitrificans]|nr:hypothetical protein DWF04_19860 [Cereibacter sphaeroides f. sp. denitrificans]